MFEDGSQMRPKLANTALLGILVVILALPLCGCDNIGDAPSVSQADYQRNLNSMNLDQRIKWIQGSPLPPDQKAKMIAEAKAASAK
jgi:hypothetical protein